mmetsp:Transcript_5392/g.8343  ORF Transcript_5392/g.8343 Transcript_5392/m.8343 type:complete len:201 (+) Transcript_5392:1042-1644(+)
MFSSTISTSMRRLHCGQAMMFPLQASKTASTYASCSSCVNDLLISAAEITQSQVSSGHFRLEVVRCDCRTKPEKQFLQARWPQLINSTMSSSLLSSSSFAHTQQVSCKSFNTFRVSCSSLHLLSSRIPATFCIASIVRWRASPRRLTFCTSSTNSSAFLMHKSISASFRHKFNLIPPPPITAGAIPPIPTRGLSTFLRLI